MLFRTALEKNFLFGWGDDQIESVGLSVETRRKWLSFVSIYKSNKPTARSDEIAEAYYTANPDEKPVGELTVAELKALLKSYD